MLTHVVALDHKKEEIMEAHMIFILVLLFQVVLDAVGDGFRVRGWQKPHHTMESVQIAVWLFLGAAIAKEWVDFQWYYMWMYVLGRIWLFDLVMNPIMLQKLFYISKSSFDGAFYYWVMGDGNPNRKIQWPVTPFAIVIKALALIWWVSWFLTDADKIVVFF